MSEAKAVPQKNVGENKPDMFHNNVVTNDFSDDIRPKQIQPEDVLRSRDATLTKEKNKLLTITTILQEIIINLLQQKLKLLDVKNKKFRNGLINAVENVQKSVNGTLENFFIASGGSKIYEFQQILNFVESMNTEIEKDSVDNIEKILEEMHLKFSNYQETFIKSKNILEKIIQPRIQQYVLFQENATSYNSFLNSSKKSFDEFEVLMKMSNQDTEKWLNVLIIAVEKAEFAYNGLKSLAVELLKFDYAEV